MHSFYLDDIFIFSVSNLNRKIFNLKRILKKNSLEIKTIKLLISDKI